jgi:hypothetical protein
MHTLKYIEITSISSTSLRQITRAHLSWGTGGGVKHCWSTVKFFKPLLCYDEPQLQAPLWMFIFPLNMLRCRGPGWFDFLVTAVRPLPGVLAALSEGLSAKQPAGLPSWPHQLLWTLLRHLQGATWQTHLLGAKTRLQLLKALTHQLAWLNVCHHKSDQM